MDALRCFGKILGKFRNARRHALLYIARNWDEDIISYFYKSGPIIQAKIIYPGKIHDCTYKLSLMFQENITYTELRSWFYENCHHFGEIPNRDISSNSTYIIEVEYSQKLFKPYSDDNSLYKMRIDFANNTIQKQRGEYWLHEEILFNQIDFEVPPEDDDLDDFGDNFLIALEEEAGIKL